MAWTNPTTRSTGYTVTATNWNEHVNNFKHLMEVAYVAFTGDVSITATTVGTANQIVSAGAVTYEAVPHIVEFFCPFYNPPGQETRVIVRDGTTVLGALAIIQATDETGPMYLSWRVTPTAASHTYNIAAWLGGAGTGTMNAGTGGAAGTSAEALAGFIRVTRVPT